MGWGSEFRDRRRKRGGRRPEFLCFFNAETGPFWGGIGQEDAGRADGRRLIGPPRGEFEGKDVVLGFVLFLFFSLGGTKSGFSFFFGGGGRRTKGRISYRDKRGARHEDGDDA